MKNNNSFKGIIKIAAEFFPLAVFFFCYKKSDMLDAAIYTAIASLVPIILFYVMDREINKTSVASLLLLCISISLSLISGDSRFIKMKPTALYIIFGAIFFVTSFKWTPASRYIFGSVVKTGNMDLWRKLNFRFMWFFWILACLNEIVWRNFAENTWVNFKVFGTLPLIFIFAMLQINYLLRNKNIHHHDS